MPTTLKIVLVCLKELRTNQPLYKTFVYVNKQGAQLPAYVDINLITVV